MLTIYDHFIAFPSISIIVKPFWDGIFGGFAQCQGRLKAPNPMSAFMRYHDAGGRRRMPLVDFTGIGNILEIYWKYGNLTRLNKLEDVRRNRTLVDEWSPL